MVKAGFKRWRSSYRFPSPSRAQLLSLPRTRSQLWQNRDSTLTTDCQWCVHLAVIFGFLLIIHNYFCPLFSSHLVVFFSNFLHCSKLDGLNCAEMGKLLTVIGALQVCIRFQIIWAAVNSSCEGNTSRELPQNFGPYYFLRNYYTGQNHISDWFKFIVQFVNIISDVLVNTR